MSAAGSSVMCPVTLTHTTHIAFSDSTTRFLVRRFSFLGHGFAYDPDQNAAVALVVRCAMAMVGSMAAWCAAMTNTRPHKERARD